MRRWLTRWKKVLTMCQHDNYIGSTVCTSEKKRNQQTERLLWHVYKGKPHRLVIKREQYAQ